MQDQDSNLLSMKKALQNKLYLLRISLHEEDLGQTQKPAPFYLKISRYNYIWQFMDMIDSYFKPYTQSLTSHEQWFEMNGKALEWDKPFGIMLDLYVPKDKQNADFYEVVIHYRNNIIGEMPSEDRLVNSIQHQFKEALYVRTDDSKTKTLIENEDFSNVFQSLLQWQIEQAFSHFQMFRAKFTSNKVPCKFYIKDERGTCSKNFHNELTFLQNLQECFPNAFETEGQFKEQYKNLKIYCGGIQIPLDVKVSYADYIFCYIDFHNYYFIDY